MEDVGLCDEAANPTYELRLSFPVMALTATLLSTLQHFVNFEPA